MSFLHHHSSQSAGHSRSHSHDSMTEPSILPNMLTGTVISVRKGLTRTALRLRVGKQTDLRIRWLAHPSTRNKVAIGQTVGVTIPQEAVQLEAGGFRRGKQRWNRWIGRVVLAPQKGADSATTVKIHQDSITLKSRGPVIGAHTPLTTWDTVNIVVDPQHVGVTVCGLPSVIEPASHLTMEPTTQAPVWLRATIRSFRSTPSGHHLSLNVGGVTLSALIEARSTPASIWMVGSSIDVNIGTGDAWIRRDAEGPMLSCCIVLSSDFDEAQRSSRAQRTNL